MTGSTLIDSAVSTSALRLLEELHCRHWCARLFSLALRSSLVAIRPFFAMWESLIAFYYLNASGKGQRPKLNVLWRGIAIAIIGVHGRSLHRNDRRDAQQTHSKPGTRKIWARKL